MVGSVYVVCGGGGGGWKKKKRVHFLTLKAYFVLAVHTGKEKMLLRCTRKSDFGFIINEKREQKIQRNC